VLLFSLPPLVFLRDATAFQVDRKKVLSDGHDVMGKLLVNLQVRKCIADGEGAREFYCSSDLYLLPPLLA
jgi:hypothetical protein